MEIVFWGFVVSVLIFILVLILDHQLSLIERLEKGLQRELKIRLEELQREIKALRAEQEKSNIGTLEMFGQKWDLSGPDHSSTGVTEHSVRVTSTSANGPDFIPFSSRQWEYDGCIAPSSTKSINPHPSGGMIGGEVVNPD